MIRFSVFSRGKATLPLITGIGVALYVGTLREVSSFDVLTFFSQNFPPFWELRKIFFLFVSVCRVMQIRFFSRKPSAEFIWAVVSNE